MTRSRWRRGSASARERPPASSWVVMRSRRVRLAAAGCLLAVACAATHKGDKAAVERSISSAGSGPEAPGGLTVEGIEADNSRCHVCHINFEDEPLAVAHAKANIGCEHCHGDSTPHCEDEDNVTPPDIMYAKADINALCNQCHPQLADTDTGAHEAIRAGTREQKYCTDCHGEHHVPHRNRRWDKRTRELITSDGGRMQEGSPGPN